MAITLLGLCHHSDISAGIWFSAVSFGCLNGGDPVLAKSAPHASMPRGGLDSFGLSATRAVRISFVLRLIALELHQTRSTDLDAHPNQFRSQCLQSSVFRDLFAFSLHQAYRSAPGHGTAPTPAGQVRAWAEVRLALPHAMAGRHTVAQPPAGARAPTQVHNAASAYRNRLRCASSAAIYAWTSISDPTPLS